MTSHPNASRPDRRLRGVTLTEAVLYISIALALIVGGLMFYRQALYQSQYNFVARSLSAMIAEARAMADEFPSQSTTQIADITDLLYIRGSVPDDIYDKTKAAGFRLVFPFSKKYGSSIATSFLPTGEQGLTILMRDLDLQFCSRMSVTSITGQTVISPDLLVGLLNDNFACTTCGRQIIGKGTTPELAGLACRKADNNNDGLVWAQYFYRYRN